MRRFFRSAARAAGILAAFSLLAMADGVRAQGAIRDWNDPADPLTNGVGLHYGRVGGHGLSFRLPLRWYLYLQPTGGIWHTSDRERHNVGLQLHYILRQDQKLRLFLGGGVAYFYDKEMTGTVNGAEVWRTDTDWNTGLGLGIEHLLGPRWSLQLEADFIRYGDSGDIQVTPQAGVYFYW